MARTTQRDGTGRARRRTGRASVAVAVLAGVLALTACTTGTEPVGEGTSRDATTSGDASATGTSGGGTSDGAWVLTSGEVDGTGLPLVEDTTVTLLVDADRASGNAACNTYTAGLDTSDGWSIGDAAVTRMACEDALMTLEQAYLDALARVDAAQVTDDVLELTGPDVRLTFAADPDGS